MMKQNKFEVEVNRILIGIESWCNEQKLEFQVTSTYSLYIKISEEAFLNSNFKSYLEETVGIAKKTLKKLTSVLFIDGRAYILFKNKAYSR